MLSSQFEFSCCCCNTAFNSEVGTTTMREYMYTTRWKMFVRSFLSIAMERIQSKARIREPWSSVRRRCETVNVYSKDGLFLPLLFSKLQPQQAQGLRWPSHQRYSCQWHRPIQHRLYEQSLQQWIVQDGGETQIWVLEDGTE